MVTLLIVVVNVKVTKERVSKEYYRDNPQGVEEEVSIKADEIEPVDPVVTEEVKEPEPAPKPKPKAKPTPPPAPEPVSEEVTEIGPRQRTRDDGTTPLGSRIFRWINGN